MRFDAELEQLFSFALDAPHELIGQRAAVLGAAQDIIDTEGAVQGRDSAAARIQPPRPYADSRWHDAHIYDRSKRHPGDRMQGPAAITEMDSTSGILPAHTGAIDSGCNILIWPFDHEKAHCQFPDRPVSFSFNNSGSARAGPRSTATHENEALMPAQVIQASATPSPVSTSIRSRATS